MMALAGIPMGHRFIFLEPAPGPPVRDLGDIVQAPYDDPAGLAQVAAQSDVVTYEFENVPAASAAFLADRGVVLPGPAALRACQDRLAEKSLFHQLDIPTADFVPVSGDDLLTERQVGDMLDRVGIPALVKTRRFGYDGKGQVTIRSLEEACSALKRRVAPGLLIEQFVRFERELSILAARSRSGHVVFYPLTENHHRGGILKVSYAPAVAPEHQAQAEEWALRVLEHLDYVGVLAIELFEVAGQLLANEVAPRVHNSGHWTANGADVSQFENHIRAVSGHSVASPRVEGWSAMLNLIGQLPDPASIIGIHGSHLHLYGKEPRPGRKLGHVTATGVDASQVLEALDRVWSLGPATGPLPRPVGWQSLGS